MRHRILMSMALLAALLFAGLTTHKPASALSCGPCPATTTDYLNLRAAPNLNAEVLLVIPAGAEVAYDTTVSPENGYYAVTYNGVDGYAHGLYLILFPASASPTDWLNLRSGPSLNDPVILVMEPGSLLQVKGRSDNGYFSVSYDQRVPGFAHGDYLTFDHTGGFVDGDAVFVRTDALNMRTGAGLDYAVETVLFNGRDLTITGGPVARDGWEWYRVDAGSDGSGWVAGEFLAYS